MSDTGPNRPQLTVPRAWKTFSPTWMTSAIADPATDAAYTEPLSSGIEQVQGGAA